MRSLFWVGGVALELLWLRVARLGDLRAHAEWFLVYVFLAFFIYFALVRAARFKIPGSSGATVIGICLLGVLFRLTLLGLTPTLSDDIYRYLWDGRVQAAGLNPYRYAPNDPALAWLRTPEWALINHPDIPTIYPPLMQAMFRLSVWLSPTVLMQKVPFLLCDAAIMGWLVWQLPRWGLSPAMSLIYAWHPLVIVEVAGSGHNDAWGAIWMLVGLGLWRDRTRLTATLAFAMSCLAKFTTALLVPFYAVRARKRLVAFLAVVFIGGLAYGGSPYVVPGFGHYSRPWEFNSSLYRILMSLWKNPLGVRALLGCGVVALGFVLARRRDDLLGYTLVMIQAALLVTPVLEPWYLLWLIPLLCLRFSWVWLIFTGLSMLSYTVLVSYMRHGVWMIPWWVIWIEYSPLYLWLVWRAWKRTVQTSDIRHQTSVMERS